MAVDTVSPEDFLAQIQEYHSKHQTEMVETAEEESDTDDGMGEVAKAKPRAKQLPRYPRYHLIYGRAGEVIDYHVDHLRGGIDALWRKLQRRYPKGSAGAGLPVWVSRLPEGAKKPDLTIPCNFPGCILAFSSPEERELHQRGFHQDWANLERDRQIREDRQTQTDQLASLIGQNQATQQQLSSLIGGFQEMVSGFTAVVGKLVEGAAPVPERKQASKQVAKKGVKR